VTPAAPPAVVERVRDRLRAERVDTSRDASAALSIARDEVRRHNDFALARGLAPIDDEAACVREVLARVTGYGPLQAYLDDPTVEEVWINAPERALQDMTTTYLPPTDLGAVVPRVAARPIRGLTQYVVWHTRH